MNVVKRDKKKEVVKPEEEDCSCTPTESSDRSHHEERYDEHCEVQKHEGKTHCRRKCRTVCVVECEKKVDYTYEWCYKTKEEKKWSECEPQHPPKKCDDKKPHDDKPRKY